MGPLSFGDKLFYTSPNNGKATPCLFIRYEGRKIVVMFENADWAARVGPATIQTVEDVARQ